MQLQYLSKSKEYFKTIKSWKIGVQKKLILMWNWKESFLFILIFYIINQGIKKIKNMNNNLKKNWIK